MYWSILLFCLLVCESYNEVIVLNTGTERLYNFFPLNRDGNIEFAVSAAHDVHVCLTNIPKYEEPYYEIALGGWWDTRSVIRYNQMDQVDYKEPVLAKKPYFSKFRVKVNFTEGSISVFKGKAIRPIMSFTDQNFIDVTYFGLSTGFGGEGIFHFDNNNIKCALPEQTNNYYSVLLNDK